MNKGYKPERLSFFSFTKKPLLHGQQLKAIFMSQTWKIFMCIALLRPFVQMWMHMQMFRGSVLEKQIQMIAVEYL